MTLTSSGLPVITDGRELLTQLRRRTRFQQIHHQTGTTAPGWLMADLATLTPGEQRRVHVWTGVHGGDLWHRRVVYVRLHERRLSVWQVDTATTHPADAVPATVPVRSVQQAIDVLVALEVLHPEWSTITATLAAGYDKRNGDTCAACDLTAGEPCPFHRGQAYGAGLLVAAVNVFVRRPVLVPGRFGRLVMLWMATKDLDTPDGPLLLRMIRHLPEDPYLMLELAAIADTFTRDDGEAAPC